MLLQLLLSLIFICWFLTTSLCAEKNASSHRSKSESKHLARRIDYSTAINYSFLPKNEVLLQASSLTLCDSKTLLCDESGNIRKHNLTFYLSTRTNSHEINRTEFKDQYYTIEALFDWLFFSAEHLRVTINASTVMEPIPYLYKPQQMVQFGQTNTPRTIFVITFGIPFFAQYVLPNLTVPFVLYSGSNDLTIPYNIDQRYIPLYSIQRKDSINNTTDNNVSFQNDNNSRRHHHTTDDDDIISYSNSFILERVDNTNAKNIYNSSWDTILKSPLLLHWFVENRVLSHKKVSTMPIGMNPIEGHPDDRSNFPEHPIPLHKRPLKVLQTDRVRPHIQFKDRKLVHELCLQDSDTCVTAHHMTNRKEYIKRVSTYPFVLCVHGGGIDPSPKAWEALLLGTIPILEHSPLDDAYSLFPVAFVTNITEFMTWNNKTEMMTQWLQELGPHYEEGSKLRKIVQEKLTTKYWWNKVTSCLKS